MNPLQQIDISTAVTDALTELFDTMLSMDLESADASAITGLGGMKIAGSVRLAGQVTGGIHIHVSETFSRRMTAAMLGIQVDDLEGKAPVEDIVGRICTAVGGSLEAKLCDSGMPCRLGPPQYTRGSDFTIETLSTARHERYVFTHQGHPVLVEVGVTLQTEDTAVGTAEGAAPAAAPVDPGALSALDLKTAVSAALLELFDTLLSLDLKAAEDETEAGLDADRVAGSVGFVGGLMGSLNLYVSQEFARTMTAGMLGVDADKIQGFSPVRDAMGRICNLLAGNVKSGLSRSGFSTRLSAPSTTVGRDFTIESRNMSRYERLVFHHPTASVRVEIALKPDDVPAGAETATMGPEADPREWIDRKMQAQDPMHPMRGQEAGAGMDPENIPPGFMGARDQPLDGPLSGPNFAFLLDVPVAVSVELGRTRKKIDDLLRMANGSIIELTKLAEEPVDIRANDTLIAKGEIVVDNDKYGVRILETISRMHRIRGL